MHFLFSIKREITDKGVECLSGECRGVPLVGFRDKDEVSKVLFRIDERVVKYILKSSGGVQSKQRFNQVGCLRWTRHTTGRDYLLGDILGIPVIVYGKADDVDSFSVYVDEKSLYESSRKQREAALEKKKGSVQKKPAGD